MALGLIVPMAVVFEVKVVGTIKSDRERIGSNCKVELTGGADDVEAPRRKVFAAAAAEAGRLVLLVRVWPENE